MTFIVNEDYIFNAPVFFNGGIKRLVTKFPPSDTTPSVRNQSYWYCANTGAVTITQFDNGSEGQDISILGDGNTTVSNNSNIKTSTGANKLLVSNKIYRFTRINNVWYEDG